MAVPLKDRRSITEQNYSKIIVHLRHVILEDLNLRNSYHIFCDGEVHSYPMSQIKITRKNLRILISKATGITYRAGIYGYIEKLLANGVLYPNSNSEGNKSRYFIDIYPIFEGNSYQDESRHQAFEEIAKFYAKTFKESVKESVTHTQPKTTLPKNQTLLSSYCGSSSPQNQAEKKDGSSSVNPLKSP